MQDNPEKLERFIAAVASQQQPLRAPAALQARVLNELARRAALPWWRSSFANWPLAAQAAFVAVCGGFIKLAFFSTTWVLGAAQTPANSVRDTVGIAHTMGDVAHALISSIPTFWIYLAAGVGVGAYVLLFGLGATAYRTLYK